MAVMFIFDETRKTLVEAAPEKNIYAERSRFPAGMFWKNGRLCQMAECEDETQEIATESRVSLVLWVVMML